VTRRTRTVLVAALALGLGLAAAPAAFQMFSRAPAGGEMLDDFRPHMRQSKLDSFRDHLARIDAAEAQSHGRAIGRRVGAGQLPAVETLQGEWSTIQSDMTGMLDDIEANVGRYKQVDALPPFPLFPWFFVLPGLIGAGIAGWGLLRLRSGRPTRSAVVALGALGVALVLAPAAFRMFSRAPAGGAMINDLRPLMTEDRVSTLQQSFLTIGAAEGELRLRALPEIAEGGAPAVEQAVERWPQMSADMAPMIGAMSDNLDNFAAVDALPPFPLFPWFFVLPGVILAGLAIAGGAIPGLGGFRPAMSVQERTT